MQIYGLMEEVALSGEVHRHTGLIGRRDDLFVAHRSAGLHDGGDAGIQQNLQAVSEREAVSYTHLTLPTIYSV